MKAPLFTVNSRKFDFSLQRTWTASLLHRTVDRLALEGVFEESVAHEELGELVKGTRSVEFFHLELWFNHFVFFEPEGSLRNHYFNISLPPKVAENIIDYIDLDVDILIWPDGRIVVLDMEEFEQNRRIYNYPSIVTESVLLTTDMIVTRPETYLDNVESII